MKNSRKILILPEDPLFSRSEDMPFHSVAVKGYQGVKIASFSVDGGVGNDENAKSGDPKEESRNAEKINQAQGQHSDEFEGVPKLVILLSEVGNGNTSHIKNNVGRKPAYVNGKIPKQKSAYHGKGIG